MRGNLYSATEDWMGNWTITRLSDMADVYLQGDDTVEFASMLDNLDRVNYPCGPFKNYEEHFDACVSDYDLVMERRTR